MKSAAHLVLLLVLVGCASRPIEVTSIRVAPVDLQVVVLEAGFVHQADALYYEVLVAIEEKSDDWPSHLNLVLNGPFPSDHDFLKPGSTWTISADREFFDHQERMGFVFVQFADIHPQRKKAQPNAQHNAGDRPPMNDSPASDTPSSPAPRG